MGDIHQCFHVFRCPPHSLARLIFWKSPFVHIPRFYCSILSFSGLVLMRKTRCECFVQITFVKCGDQRWRVRRYVGERIVGGWRQGPTQHPFAIFRCCIFCVNACKILDCIGKCFFLLVKRLIEIRLIISLNNLDACIRFSNRNKMF